MLLALIGGLAVADFDNYPVKSINLDAAPAVSSYTALSFSTVADAHAVHGMEIKTGSLSGYSVFVGKGLRCEPPSCTDSESFLTVITPAGTEHWTWTPADAGNDAANAVIQLPVPSWAGCLPGDR